MTGVPEDLRSDLECIWSADTAYEPELWTHERPSTGQCAITALIVHALFGGEIVRYGQQHASHYANLIDDEVVDLTADQYDFDIAEFPFTVADRGEMVLNDETYYRFTVLSQRLMSLWETQRRTLRLVVNG